MRAGGAEGQQRLLVCANPRQCDDLDVHVREQDVFRRELSQSRLPRLELDMSHLTISAAAGRVADWLESSGGLYQE